MPNLQLLYPIYQQAGMCVHDSQRLEYAITYIITLLKDLGSNGLDDLAFDDSMESLGKKTLGTLIKEIKKHVQFSCSPEEALSLALKNRNYIIHKIFNDLAENLLTRDGRQSFLDELTKIRASMFEAYKILDDIASKLTEIKGLSLEVLHKELEGKYEE